MLKSVAHRLIVNGMSFIKHSYLYIFIPKLYALRVSPAVTRLTVYRRLQVLVTFFDFSQNLNVRLTSNNFLNIQWILADLLNLVLASGKASAPKSRWV